METSTKGTDFVFGYVYLLYYKCQGIYPNCGGLFIDFSDLIKNKKATKPINKNDDKCLQYTATIALVNKKVKKNLLKEYQKLNLL